MQQQGGMQQHDQEIVAVAAVPLAACVAGRLGLTLQLYERK